MGIGGDADYKQRDGHDNDVLDPSTSERGQEGGADCDTRTGARCLRRPARRSVYERQHGDGLGRHGRNERLVAWSSYYQVPTGPPKAFRDNLKVATKAGGYTLSNQHYLSIAGYVEIPFKTAYRLLPQKYTFGIFIHKATKDVQLVNDAFEEAIGKLFLEEIKLAMGTFF
jgi:hypothetical protein